MFLNLGVCLVLAALILLNFGSRDEGFGWDAPGVKHEWLSVLEQQKVYASASIAKEIFLISCQDASQFLSI